ncbi:MAG TPA: hypothetical protein DD979_13955 [Gammaproteobacteria bacterium]|jgi:hypothetical protein|nr:hypothetical protein [Gammaproteobacteria bacterium]
MNAIIRTAIVRTAFWVCLFCVQPIAADTPSPLEIGDTKLITPFHVEYTVGNNLINAGVAKLTLEAQGDEWVYSLVTKPSGIFKLTGKGRIHEVSVINVTQEQLIPQRYSYRQAGDQKKRDVDAVFNWQNQELTIKRKGKEETEVLTDPILDRLSVTLTVMELVRKGFSSAELQVLDAGKIKTMQFINDGTERVDTKLGTLDTIVVRRVREGSSRETITWFAPDLNYVPVQIEQRKRGKLVARLKINKLKNQPE